MTIPEVTDPNGLQEYVWKRTEELYADPAVKKAVDRQETAMKTTLPLTTGTGFSHYRGNVLNALELVTLWREMGNAAKADGFFQTYVGRKGEFVAGLGRVAYLAGGGTYVFEEVGISRQTVGALAFAADQTDWANEQETMAMYKRFKAVRLTDSLPDVLIG